MQPEVRRATVDQLRVLLRRCAAVRAGTFTVEYPTRRVDFIAFRCCSSHDDPQYVSSSPAKIGRVFADIRPTLAQQGWIGISEMRAWIGSCFTSEVTTLSLIHI